MRQDVAPEGSEDRLSEALDRRAADRRWRKQRPLVLLAAAVALILLLANLVLALSVRDMRAELDEVRAASGAAPGEETGDPSSREVEALRSRVQELMRALYGTGEVDAQDGGSLPALRKAIVDLRGEVRASLERSSCTDRGLRHLDDSLRQLLTRDLDPNAYVQEGELPTCP